jgi:hypothetical protein
MFGADRCGFLGFQGAYGASSGKPIRTLAVIRQLLNLPIENAFSSVFAKRDGQQS